MKKRFRAAVPLLKPWNSPKPSVDVLDATRPSPTILVMVVITLDLLAVVLAAELEAKCFIGVIIA